MKKIIILLLSIIFSACKENNEEQKLIYKQLVHYRDELKINTRAMEDYISIQAEENKSYKNAIEQPSEILSDYEKKFEKLKYKERDKIVKLRDSFNNQHKLFLHFDTSNYDSNISDTIFNRLMEIDFYRLKISFQNRILRRGCK